MAFHEIRFPTHLGFGALGGPERRTEVVELANGHEERNSPWAQSRRRYDAGLGLRALDDLEEVIAFFEARQGMLHAFRWKDWADFRSAPASRALSSSDQLLGTGDGETQVFQLRKAYASGAQTYFRTITKPVAGTVRVARDGVELAEGVDFSVDPTSGRAMLVQAPGTGAEIRAGFEFDVPVRFDTDMVQVSVASFKAGQVPQVPVVEVRL